MQDIVASFIVILLGFALVGVASGFSDTRDRPLILVALAMHFAFALASYWIMENVFFVSDVHAYVDDGAEFIPLLDAKPFYWLFELTKMICRLPNETRLESGPTESMVAVAGIGLYLTNSVWAIFLLCTIVSYLGKWSLFAAFRDELGFVHNRGLLVASMMIPSCVYWTSGLVKESFAMAGVGFLFRGAQLLLKRFHPLGMPLLAIGFALVAGFKPFFLFAFVIAVAMWILFAKTKRDLAAFAPFIFAGGIGLAIAGIAVLGTQFKEFAVDRVVETVAQHQQYAAEAEGGSNYTIGDPTARSALGQVAFAPLALLTTLARPLPFEIHNVTSAIASTELFVLTVLLIQALRMSGFRGSWRNIFSRPVLVFAFVFTIIAGTGVGLATGNLGTLSRYRTPLLPFYAVLILGLRHAARQAPAVVASPPRSKRLTPLERALAARPTRLVGRSSPAAAAARRAQRGTE